MGLQLFGPDSAFNHLLALAQQYRALDGRAVLNSVASVETAFDSSVPLLTQLFSSLASTSTQIVVNLKEGPRTITIKTYDQSSNIQAIRTLFQVALVRNISQPLPEDEVREATIINFVLSVDRETTPESACQILNRHVGLFSEAPTLQTLDGLCSKASTVCALTIDVQRYLLQRQDPTLLRDLCCKLCSLCERADKSSGEIFLSIIRKIFDISFVAIIQQARTNPTLTEQERMLLLCGLWHKMNIFFLESLKTLPQWANRVMSLQEQTAISKAAAALDLPQVIGGVERLLKMAQAAETAEDRTAAIAALTDLKQFLEQTANRTQTLESAAKLDLLVKKTRTQIAVLKAPDVEKVPKDRRWGVAKRILFDLTSPLHNIVATAFGGAVTGAFIGLVSGGGVPGMVVGAVAGGVSDAGTAVVGEGIEPAVNALPLSAPRQRRIVYYARAVGLPLFRFFLSVVTARWLTVRFAARRAERAAREEVRRLSQLPEEVKMQDLPGHTEALHKALQKIPEGSELKQVSLRISNQVPDPGRWVSGQVRGVRVVSERVRWSKTDLVVELPAQEIPRLQEVQWGYSGQIQIVDQPMGAIEYFATV